MKQRLRDGLRRHVALLLAIAIGCFLARWLYLRGKPEYLGDLPNNIAGGFSTIKHAKLIWEGQDRGLNVLYTRAVTGGATHILGRITLPSESTSSYLAAEDTDVYCIRELTPRTVFHTQEIRHGDQREIRTRTTSVGKYSIIVQRIPLAGGPTQTISRSLPLPPQLAPVDLALAGNAVYWLSKRSQQQIPIQVGFKKLFTLLIYYDLMAAPLNGGPVQKVRLDRPVLNALQTGDNAVYCQIQSRPGEVQNDLYRYHAGDAGPQLLRGYGRLESPIELNGRLYGIVFGDHREDAKGAAIVSAGLDASDWRVGAKLSAYPELNRSAMRLALHRGKLYLIGSRTETSGTAERMMLFRVHLERDGALEKLCTFPPGRREGFLLSEGVFDGKDFYLAINEHRENVFDWSVTGLSGTEAPALYRYHLPD